MIEAGLMLSSKAPYIFSKDQYEKRIASAILGFGDRINNARNRPAPNTRPARRPLYLDIWFFITKYLGGLGFRAAAAQRSTHMAPRLG